MLMLIFQDMLINLLMVLMKI